MSEAMIILAPGQGAQHVGMGKAWAEASEEAAAVFAKANEVLGFDLSENCFNGPEDQINRTDIAQAALYTTSIAAYEGLKARGALGEVVAVGGLSLGEFTALHIAGSFSFEDGLKLVWQRGSAMQEAAEANPSSMVALIGGDEEQAVELCEKAKGDQVLVPANFNCPGQIVISGGIEACKRAVEVAGEMRLRAVPLTVAGAFHSPLMQSAADKLAAALAEVEMVSPKIPVMSNVTGKTHEANPDTIREGLVKQLTSSVRWEANLRWLLENVDGQMAELAPGKVLSGHMKKIDRKYKVLNFASPE